MNCDNPFCVLGMLVLLPGAMLVGVFAWLVNLAGAWRASALMFDPPLSYLEVPIVNWLIYFGLLSLIAYVRPKLPTV
jgi:hypothetical protein